MTESKAIVNQFFEPLNRLLTLGSKSPRFGVLGFIVVVLPTLGGCAAAGVASALSGGRDDPSVSVVELQAAAANLDSTVESSDSGVSVGSAGNTITLSGGATTSVHYDASGIEAASINVGSSTVRGTFDANSQLTDISITSEVRALSFSEVYNTGTNSFSAYNWDEDTGSGRDEWVAGKNLSYMGFGMWSSTDIDGEGGWGDMYHGVYAVGSASTSLPTSGVASYLGASTGWLKGTYIYTPFVANVSANFDFSSRAGTFVMSNTRSYYTSGFVATGVTLSNYNFTAPVALQSTSFSGTLTSSGGYSGWVAGTFYGPNADEIGGGILFSDRGFATFGASK